VRLSQRELGNAGSSDGLSLSDQGPSAFWAAFRSRLRHVIDDPRYGEEAFSHGVLRVYRFIASCGKTTCYRMLALGTKRLRCRSPSVRSSHQQLPL
jgi:hypothetical protein